jgi:ATP-dependent DNA ligase
MTFDLIRVDGEDWRPRPLEECKAQLARLMSRAREGIHYNEHIAEDGAAVFTPACLG